MTLVNDFYKKGDCFIVVTSGSYDLEQSIAIFDWVLTACKLSDIYNILIDYRKLEIDSTATEKVIYASEIIKKHKSLLKLKPIKIAYLGRPSHLESYQPSYQMAKDEKLPVLLTSDSKEATSWLGLQEPYS